MGGKKGHKEGQRNSLRAPGGGETPAEGTELQTQLRGTNVAPPRLARLWEQGGLPWLGRSHLALRRGWMGRRGSPGPGGLTWLWKASGSCSLRRPQTRALLNSYRVTSPGGGGGGNSPKEHMAAPSLGASPGWGATAEISGALGMRRLQAGGASAGPADLHPLTASGDPRFSPDTPGSPSLAPRPEPPAPPCWFPSPLPAPGSRQSPPRAALVAAGAWGGELKGPRLAYEKRGALTGGRHRPPRFSSAEERESQHPLQTCSSPVT